MTYPNHSVTYQWGKFMGCCVYNTADDPRQFYQSALIRAENVCAASAALLTFCST
jgi:hypothetical protein